MLSSAAIFQHLDDFVQLSGQLPGPPFAELVGKAAIVPECFLARLAEAGPDGFAHVGLSQIAKDRTGIVDLVRERDAQNVVIGGVEMGRYASSRFRQSAFRSPLAVSARLSEHAATTWATRSPNRLRTSSSRALPP